MIFLIGKGTFGGEYPQNSGEFYFRKNIGELF